MKQISLFGRACAGLLVALALAACGVGQARAATLSHNLKCDSGYVFQLDDAQSFRQVQGAVVVKMANATDYTIADATGACFTKLINATTSTYVIIPGSLEYINTVAPLYIFCYASNPPQSGFAYAGASNQPRFIPDNCALYNSIRTQSN